MRGRVERIGTGKQKNIFISNNMRTFYQTISFFGLIFLLPSCLYDTNQLSEVDIAQPQPGHMLTLTLSEDKDSLIIFGETAFRYDVNTFGLDFTAIEVNFKGQSYLLDKSSGALSITPDWDNTTDWLDLTINFYASTGTGSIADLLKAENYVGTKTWKVKYVDLRKHDYSLHQRISADSILQIYYLNPHYINTLQGDLTRFPLVNMKLTSRNGDTLFFADSSYFRGPASYRLEITKNVGYNRYFDLSVNYDSFSRLTVTDINKDSCLVSWTSIPFKVDYMVIDSYVHVDHNVYYKGDGHSFKDTQPKPGWGKFYYLYARSKFNKSDAGWSLFMIVYWKDHAMY